MLSYSADMFEVQEVRFKTHECVIICTCGPGWNII